jgi:hypothetical protein
MLDPNTAESRTDMQLPNRRIPYAEMLDPKREHERTDRDDPQ